MRCKDTWQTGVVSVSRNCSHERGLRRTSRAVSTIMAAATPSRAAKKYAGTKARRATAHAKMGTGALTVAAGKITGVILPVKSPRLYSSIKITGYLHTRPAPYQYPGHHSLVTLNVSQCQTVAIYPTQATGKAHMQEGMASSLSSDCSLPAGYL